MPSPAAARTAAPRFRLQFDIGRVPELASHYYAPYDSALEAIAPDVQRQRLYTRDQLLLACFWKSPRTKPRVAENEDAFVREVTGLALTAADERIRIGVCPRPLRRPLSDPGNAHARRSGSGAAQGRPLRPSQGTQSQEHVGLGLRNSGARGHPRNRAWLRKWTYLLLLSNHGFPADILPQAIRLLPFPT
jgi:hypothetical protein